MKVKILIFIDWFIPASKAGGPVQSIYNMVRSLGDDLDFSIVTSDRDLGDKVGFTSVSLNTWIEMENFRVIYLDPNNQKISTYQKIFQDKVYEFIYFNSLFSINFTLKPFWLARKTLSKVILAPRGMLGPGALRFKKIKKQIFLKIFQISGVADKITWHATAESEVEEIKYHFGEKIKFKLAPNLSAPPRNENVFRIKETYNLNLFFYSRIVKKKNLKGVIQYLYKIPQEFNVNLTIIGPVGEKDYWKECKKMFERLPSSIKTEYVGSIDNSKLASYLKNQHFLFLPTFHENFGHAIMESWQHGCPVIISDQTPWKNLHENGIGWDIPLEKPEQFFKVILEAGLLGQEEYEKMSLNAFEFAYRFSQNSEILDANRRLFLI